MSISPRAAYAAMIEQTAIAIYESFARFRDALNQPSEIPWHRLTKTERKTWREEAVKCLEEATSYTHELLGEKV